MGIGASAGGLKALTSLFSEIPADISLAFVVIQHLDPHRESLLPTLLAKCSRLPVVEMVDGIEVLPARIYVIAPNTAVGIDQHGRLRVSPRDGGPGPHLVIDAFLESLALARPGNSLGVILSGAGADGTRGLAAMKAVGGITFAQDDTAEYVGMPLSAIDQHHVDFILAPGDIAKELVRIAHAGFPSAAPLTSVKADEDDGDTVSQKSSTEEPEHYAMIIGLLHQATGIDFTHYRATTIMRRTMRRMAMIPKTSLADYARYLAEFPGEIDALARDILINVTSFYRDAAVFETLKSLVFPELTKARSHESPIRLWIVGCSTGQEVYSLAMELMEQLKDTTGSPRVQIFATDISEWALAKARLGSYPESIVDEIPPDRLAKYFTREGPEFRIAKDLRDLCVFAKHDVTVDTPFSRIDFISCRNVLIYLGPALQKHVLPTFHFALKPGGFLLLGTSETLGRAAVLYETIDEKHRLYRALGSVRRLTPRVAPSLRLGAQGLSSPLLPTLTSNSETQRAADQIVLGRYAPAGVLVSEANEIIQFRGETNAYLQPAQGEASLNLLTMVPFGVAEALREALNEVKRDGLPIRRSGIAHSRGQAVREISFEVIPIKLPSTSTSFLVLFSEQSPVMPTASGGAVTSAALTSPAITGADLREAVQLRIELAAATDYVHSLVELNHVQAEQLKEAQEESQSSTEEYRSTNEELQTTKEEIESTNEELITINDELRSTNEQLGKASAELRASGELTSAIVETMRYPLLVLSASLRVESANQAFLDTFKVDREETIDQLIYNLGNGQWNIPELRRLLEDILPSNSAFDDFEVTHDFGHIGVKTMLLNARRLKGDDDHSRSIVLVIADITERTLIAKNLKMISNELMRSNAELDQFAAVASHDLQEPLRLMSSYIDLLQRRYGGLFDERAQSYMTYVTNGAQRMSEMIGAILSYSRLGHEGAGMTSVDSSVALERAVENLQSKISESHGAIVGVGLPRVHANLEQLTRLFQNILSNSLKFRSPARSPMIRVNAQESDQAWTFAITDNGVGMEKIDQVRIFELFHRAHPEREIQGCGIGLAICKKIVEHHHGRIWVESQLDVGSTFYFTVAK